MSFQTRLKSLIEFRHLSQVELAKKADLWPSAISAYLKGEYQPKSDKIDLLADALSVPADYLLLRDDLATDIVQGMGPVVAADRADADLSQKDAARAAGVPLEEVADLESGSRCSAYAAKQIIELALGFDYYSYLNNYFLYDEYIPPQFDGDADAYEAFKAAVDADATATPYQGPNVIAFTPEERAMISEYRELDIYGKESVSWTIQHELKRCKAAARHDIPSIIEQAGASYSHRIPFPGKVSAGTGVETIVGYDTIAGPARADFALLIDGDSMVPRYHDGQVIYIKSQPVVDNGQIAVVQVQGINDFIPRAYLKKVYKETDHVRLASLNRKYADLKVSYEDLTVLGVVIG